MSVGQYTHYPFQVTSLNGLTGALTLSAGSNITIMSSGSDLIISATGGGGGSGFSTIGTYDTGVATTDGLNASGTTLFAQSASATDPGMVNTGAQTFAGDKTFSGHIINSSLTPSRAMVTSSGSILTTAVTTAAEIAFVNGVTSSIQTQLNSKQATLTIGDLTDAGTDGIVVTNGAGSVIGSGTSIAQHVADATHNGYLALADWSTFNGKQASGNYLTALTGDATASGPGSAALTLATVNGNVGSFGSATQVAGFTVNAKGLVTAASNTSIQIAESQVTNLTTDLAAKQAGPLTGDITTSGAASTLATVNSNVGSFTSANITVNAKGLITAAANGTSDLSITAVKTGTYSIASTDSLVPCDSSGGTFTVTLPTAIGITGRVIRIKKVDTSTTIVTIATTSSQTVDSNTTTTLTLPFEEISVVSNGTNWYTLDSIQVVGGRFTNTATTISGSPVKIVWTNTNNLLNATYATGTVTMSYAGWYSVTAALLIGSTATAGNAYVVYIYKNGSEIKSTLHRIIAATTDPTTVQVTDILYFAKGDTLEIFANGDGTGPTISSSTTRNVFSFSRMK